jgi:putative ABC transport system substrate-binding protein
MKRREFIAGLGSVAASPLAAQAQQSALPVVACIKGGLADENANGTSAFRKALAEAGYVEGQNVTVEYHWLEGQYDRLPALMADLVRRRVSVIATPANTPGAIAAKAATSTIPIVFGVALDPVRLGLVASLARPGGNATGINFFTAEVVAKRLGLLQTVVTNALRIAVLLDPANTPATEAIWPEVQEAARALGLQIRPYKPARAARSTRPLPPSRASAPMRCSSLPNSSSTTAACNWPTWRRASESQLPMEAR